MLVVATAAPPPAISSAARNAAGRIREIQRVLEPLVVGANSGGKRLAHGHEELRRQIGRVIPQRLNGINTDLEQGAVRIGHDIG